MKKMIEEYVGKIGTIEVAKMRFKVRIVDYKFSYGKDRFCVEPVAGEKMAWVEKVLLD